jgi:xylose isomerase
MFPKDEFTPTKADRFTFGLWTVGNRGRDPFGMEVRDPIPPARIVQKLSTLGAYGVNSTTTTWCPSTPRPPSATASCATSAAS